jgi:multidrug efflux pump subunit AcrA (membrane-fusion protein)
VKQRLFSFQATLRKMPVFIRTLPPGRFVSHVLYSGAITVGFFFLILFLPWQQTSQGQGRVLALSPNERPQVISAPVSARIDKWFVVEGQSVKRGEKIAALADLDVQIIARLEDQISASKQKVDATQVLVETSKKNADRTYQLFREGLLSQRDGEKAKQEYAEALIDAANAQSELAKMEVSLSRQLSQEILAPMDGYIMSIMAGQGGAIVKAGDELATLVPATESRVVEMLIDANDLPLVEKGSRTRLQFEGWPAIQFSGAPDLAYGTFSGVVTSVDPFDMNRGMFRLIISEDPSIEDGKWPPPSQLRQGIRVKGWVLLGRVAVGYEIWRRMNGFPPNRDRPIDRKKDKVSAGDSSEKDKEIESGDDAAKSRK